MELLRDNDNDRNAAVHLYDDKIIKVFSDADKQKYLNVLQDWHNKIYSPDTGVRRKLYPQALLYELCDALSVRSLTNETALRDLGLFSKIILDVEQIYISIDSAARYRDMLNYFQNIAKNAYELEQIDYLTKENAVNISTIHKVKGLEFPVVFVADMVNQRFPGRTSQYNGDLPADLMADAFSRGAYGNRIEDEARLFYTAITRAEMYVFKKETKKQYRVKAAEFQCKNLPRGLSPSWEIFAFSELVSAGGAIPASRSYSQRAISSRVGRLSIAPWPSVLSAPHTLPYCSAFESVSSVQPSGDVPSRRDKTPA